ncbi:ORF6N domain-containing protein [Odoribacter splanchnicus]|uniref:ORF6N domain-containing protein n=1 Tax=Odoribacter splanchnicus TaxID=28118 RepID=UPI001585A2DD|nr:ORF6N domain-containing protein [Odoribacter splanchnicus]NUN84897.1 ORF6N domain-containing protein [Odoribacter splanchnicus]
MNQLELIQSKIYEIRGQRVMLDFDLAQMYGTETAQLKRAVRRNKKRFDGEDFMFEVTRDELSRCQIGTLNKSRGSNIKYLPFAFAMLSSVLNSETAIEINKGIMRAFVAIRQLIANPPPDKHSLLQKEVKELKQYIEEIFADQNDINEDTRIQPELINQTLAELQVHQKLSDKPRRPIGFIRPQED